MEADAGPELARLLDALERAAYEDMGDACVDAARAALLAHIAANYVRRDRLTPDEWDQLDATAPTVERWPDPPIVARQRTLHADAAGNVVEGAADFEGDE